MFCVFAECLLEKDLQPLGAVAVVGHLVFHLGSFVESVVIIFKMLTLSWSSCCHARCRLFWKNEEVGSRVGSLGAAHLLEVSNGPKDPAQGPLGAPELRS